MIKDEQIEGGEYSFYGDQLGSPSILFNQQPILTKCNRMFDIRVFPKIGWFFFSNLNEPWNGILHHESKSKIEHQGKKSLSFNSSILTTFSCFWWSYFQDALRIHWLKSGGNLGIESFLYDNCVFKMIFDLWWKHLDK